MFENGRSCEASTHCWSFEDAATSWTSPELRVEPGARLVVHVRAAEPFFVDWQSGGTERRLARLKTSRPWSTEILTVPLPDGQAGRVRIHSGGDLDLSFAELLERGRGRCYADTVRVGKLSRDGFVCVGPAVSESGSVPKEVKALRLFRAALEPKPVGGLRVEVSGGDGEREIALLPPPPPDRWIEQTVPLPAESKEVFSLRLSVTGPDDAALAWSAQPVREPADPAHPNVIVYMIDTLRADALGSYGAARPTRRFDTLAAGGATFESVSATSPWTLPSVASLFTGLNLLEHGVIYDRDALNPEIPTLPEILEDAGYTTAAVTASLWVGERHHTDRGFQELHDVSPGRGPWGIRAGTTSADANAIVLDWIERHASEPFFLYVHVIDPHQPYTPPDRLAQSFVRPTGWEPGDPRWRAARSPSDGRRPPDVSTSDVERMEPGERSRVIEVSRDIYDAAVAHTDLQLGRLLDALERSELTERTLVVVVSDHGEEFLEHGFTGHALSLYDEVIRIPLLFSQPGRIPAGLRVAEPAGLIDVAPTVLSLAGLPVPESMDGIPLLPREGGSPSRPFLLIRRVQGRRTPIPGVPDMNGVALGRFKLIHNLGDPTGRPEWELFDRLDDPGERNNLAPSQPEQLAELQELLRGMVERSGRFRRDAAGEPDPETLEKLRGLGYVD